jgi:hypothetical protein
MTCRQGSGEIGVMMGWHDLGHIKHSCPEAVCYLTGLILIAMHCIKQLLNRSILQHMTKLARTHEAVACMVQHIAYILVAA